MQRYRDQLRLPLACSSPRLASSHFCTFLSSAPAGSRGCYGSERPSESELGYIALRSGQIPRDYRLTGKGTERDSTQSAAPAPCRCPATLSAHSPCCTIAHKMRRRHASALPHSVSVCLTHSPTRRWSWRWGSRSDLAPAHKNLQ